MAFVGFAVMTPVATMSILDTTRWRPVVYADTPKTLNRYHRFIQKPTKDDRKPVLFVFGAAYLPKVTRNADLFSSVFLFDDVPNLMAVKTNIPEFDIVDIEGQAPKHLTPVELAEVVSRAGALPNKVPLLTKLTNTLGPRKPSVLESTSRLPKAEATTETSGVQRLLTEVKQYDALPYAVVTDTYAKFVFRMIPRSAVTTAVTKRLPAEAKEPWAAALAIADSAVGLAMADAFRKLCDEPAMNYREVITPVLKPYAGDFLYLTAIHPPYKGCVFLSTPGSAANQTVKPINFVPKDNKTTEKRKKKAKR